MPTEISGFPTFNAQIGGSSAIGTSEIVASVNTTAVGTISNTNETDLMTYVLPANTLNANNIGVRITAWGTTLAAANNQTISLYFGSAQIQTVTGAMSTSEWRLTADVIRTASNAQTYGCFRSASGGFVATPGGTTSQTDTAAITIKVTGQNGVATVNGVKQLGMVVEVINLPGGGAVPNPYLPASLNQSTASKVVTPDAGMYSWAAGDVSVSRATSNIIQVGDGGANANGGIRAYSVQTLMGTSGTLATVPAVANVNITAVGTIANTNETDLITYSLPANSLSANGKGVRITAWGTTLAAANNQVIRVYFGTQTVISVGALAFGTNSWKFVTEVIRTGSNAQISGSSFVAGTQFYSATQATAQTDSGAITIKCTGTNGVSTVDGVKQLGLIVEMIN